MTARVISLRGEGRARLAEAAVQAVALKPEGWRDLWPQIVDYEEAFMAGFEFFAPDLIHLHDPEPMAGAVAYQQERRAAVEFSAMALRCSRMASRSPLLGAAFATGVLAGG